MSACRTVTTPTEGPPKGAATPGTGGTAPMPPSSPGPLAATGAAPLPSSCCCPPLGASGAASSRRLAAGVAAAATSCAREVLCCPSSWWVPELEWVHTCGSRSGSVKAAAVSVRKWAWASQAGPAMRLAGHRKTSRSTTAAGPAHLQHERPLLLCIAELPDVQLDGPPDWVASLLDYLRARPAAVAPYITAQPDWLHPPSTSPCHLGLRGPLTGRLQLPKCTAARCKAAPPASPRHHSVHSVRSRLASVFSTGTQSPAGRCLRMRRKGLMVAAPFPFPAARPLAQNARRTCSGRQGHPYKYIQDTPWQSA